MSDNNHRILFIHSHDGSPYRQSYYDDSAPNQFETDSYLNPLDMKLPQQVQKPNENVSTVPVRQTRRKGKADPKQQFHFQKHVTVGQEPTISQLPIKKNKCNETKNLPSQMGRMIINHLKSKGFKNLPAASTFTNLNEFNCLILNKKYTEHVLNYFETNQILFDHLKSPRLQLNTLLTVIDTFNIYYQGFRDGNPIANQTK